MKLVLLQVCFVLFTIGCSNNKKTPRNIIKPVKMQAILADLMTADALNQQRIMSNQELKITSENAAYYKKIFQLHTVTKKDFDKSFQFYLKRPDLMKVILDSLSAEVNRKDTVVANLKDSLKNKRNGSNIRKTTGQSGRKQ